MNGSQSMEEILMRHMLAGQGQGGPTITSPVPTVPGAEFPVGPTVEGPPEIPLNIAEYGIGGRAGVPAGPSITDQLLSALQTYQVPLIKMGTAMMGGKETIGGQIGGILGEQAASTKLNEALRKMVASQLGGGKDFMEGQPVGLSSADVAGLTPEQITGLYSTGLGLRAAELKRPLEHMQVVSDAYLKIMTGQAKPAEMEQHYATAQKAYQEMAAAPVKNMAELYTKIMNMQKAEAEIGEIRMRTEALRAEPEKKEAEIKKTKAEARKLELETDPTYMAFKKRLETEYGTPLHEVRLGNEVKLTNPITGKPVASFEVGAPPEAGVVSRKKEVDLAKAAMVRIAPIAVRYLDAELAALPGGKQKVDLQNLIASLRGYTGEIDPGVLLARTSPELEAKFNRLIDIYTKTSLPEAEFGKIAHVILGGPGAEAALPPTAQKPAEKKPMYEKFRPTPQSAALTEGYSTALAGKSAGVYGFGDKQVKWDGTKVLGVEPRKGAAERPQSSGKW